MIDIKLMNKPQRLFNLIKAWRRDLTPIQEAARTMAKQLDPPVDTGELASSIVVTGGERTGDSTRARVEIYADHAVYVEFGTDRRAPNPFIRTAFKKGRQPSVLRYIKALKRHKP